ncbi:MAG: cation transporter, partial [Lachnospiraceae bacterium]|nr:cation transporter [Lachnospiraceae bacterium]
SRFEGMKLLEADSKETFESGYKADSGSDVNNSDDNSDKNNNTNEGGSKMTVTLNIEGMMCEHCEAHAKKELEKIEGVKVNEISHEKGIAVVEAPETVSVADFKAAVEEAGYELK